jgi:2-pyrone-4,6-dicarboxylate lactonase
MLTQVLPKNSCDSQVHVFGGPYPLSQSRRYDPPDNAAVDAMLRMHAALGIERGVIVQASAQGWDTRYLVDALKAAPKYRGVILMNENISDHELHLLHDAGVRGARFVFLQGYNVSVDPRSIERSMARVTELGWFSKIFVTADDWLAFRDILTSIKTPVLIDHLGFLDPTGGVEQPSARVILDLLSRENYWMMLSSGNRISKDARWDDVIPLARAFVDAAPDRVVWGSDWPHVAHEIPLPDTADLLELLFRFVPDRAQLEKILVTNPERFFGLS